MRTNKPRVWWVQCKPFNEDERYSQVCQDFQEYCLKNNYFGMGWKWSEMNTYAGMDFSREIADKLVSFIREQNESTRTFSGAQNKYAQMEPGHVVVTRLNDIYYAGIIAFVPKFSNHEKLTWYSKIRDNWTRLGRSEDLPHHVRGLLSSSKYHGTVAEIDGLSAYTIMNSVGIECKKQAVNADSFMFALGDEDLEDLMAHYMLNKNKGYVFLPSSCKKNTPGIEFIMYNPNTEETIACQTKVNRTIDVKWYIQEDCFRKYKAIYLYSGNGYDYLETAENSNIIVVSNKDLYEIFKENAYFTNMVNQYFDFE